MVTAAILRLSLGDTAAMAKDQPAWSLVPDLRIGAVEDPRYVLEAVRYLVVGPHGRVYAADPQAGNVLVFDRDGEFVRAIGRRGQGPGEFQTISRIGLVGERLWVADRLKSQITVFSADGDAISTRPLPRELSLGTERPPRAFGMLADESILALAEAAPFEAGGTVMQVLPLLRYVPGTMRPDTLLSLHRMPTSMVFPSQGQYRTAAFPLPRNNDRWSIAPDGSFVVVVRSVESQTTNAVTGYTVEAVDASGRVVFRRQFNHTAIPVPEDLRDRIHGDFASTLMRMEGGTRFGAVGRARDLLPIPKTRLAIDWIVVGSDGRIWLHRLDRPGVFVALNGQTGEVVGEASFPNASYPGVGVDSADDQFIWMVERDNLDIPYIVRYRIVTGREQVVRSAS